MSRATVFGICLWLLVLETAFGQVQTRSAPSGERISASGSAEVAAKAGKDRIRFVSLGEARRMRLEVLDQAGGQVYDSGFRDGTLLDWKLEDAEQRRLPDGLYGCAITVEDLAGLQSHRRAVFWVKEGGARFAERARAAAEGAGAVEQDDAVAVVLGDEALPVAHVGHDGRTGVIAGGKGGLSIRTGDLFAGKDVEHVRLTAEGKLGVGTEEPAAKLDVAGLIRTSEGIQFPDGSIQRTAARFQRTAALGPVTGSSPAGAFTMSGPLETAARAGRDQATGGGRGRVFGTEGATNTFYGSNAGLNNDGGNYNSFFGASAGYSNIGGDYNSFFGRSAGYYNTTGAANSFFGYFAGYSNTTGGDNSFFGRNAGSSNTTGASNSFFGREAGRYNSTGASNSFFGRDAGRSNTTANSNSFFGRDAGYWNTTGSSNSFFGLNAGRSNTAGGANSFFGREAGYANTTGGLNAFFGRLVGYSNTTGNRNSFFGNEAGYSNTTGSSNSFFGDLAGYVNTTGGDNSFFGGEAGSFNTTGNSNSFFGHYAGRYNTTGGDNSFFGRNAGQANTTGGSNAFFGGSAGYANTTGVYNSFFGRLAGSSNTWGNNNAFLGGLAGYSNTAGTANAFVGGHAGLLNTTGGDNSFVGGSAGHNNTEGGYNAFFGGSAGYFNTTGTYNSFFGYSSGGSNSTEHNNTFLGALSNGATAIANATAVGYRATVTQGDSLVLGSINGVNGATSDTSVGIGTTAPAERLHVVGNILATGTVMSGAPSAPVPDYVFEPDYKLMSIEQLEKYVARERHLPNIPKASEIQAKGLDLGAFQMKLLEKIEELTLYTLEQAKKIRELEKAIANLGVERK